MLLLISSKITLKLLRVKVERIKLLPSACCFLEKGESGEIFSFYSPPADFKGHFLT